MSIVRNFNLYLNAGNGSAPYINVNQYDQGEQWVFTLYKEDGTKYTPSTGAIVGIKADNRGIINTGTVDADGRVVINETQQMTAAAGIAIFELLIDGETHGTANFLVNVEQRPGENADLSDSDLSLIQQAVDSAEVIVEVIGDGDPSEVIGEHVDAWLDNHPEATTTVEDGAITAPKINNSLWDKLLVSEEASGNPASFDDGADDVPVSSLKVALEPVQLGSGDPSPSNVRPISGHSSVTVERTGKNLLQNTATSKTENGITFTVNADGTVTTNGTSTALANLAVGRVYVIVGETYILKATSGGSLSTYKMRAVVRDTNDSAINIGGTLFQDAYNGIDKSITMPSNASYMDVYCNVENGQTISNALYEPMVRLASVTDSTYEPYTSTSYPYSLGQTVYGGTVDLATGVLTVTHKCYIASQTSDFGRNNETSYYVRSEIISDSLRNGNTNIAQSDKFKSWRSGISTNAGGIVFLNGGGAGRFNTVAPYNSISEMLTGIGGSMQIYYPLATPTTVQLTPQEVKTLLGYNNISSSGTVDVIYHADTKLYVDKMTNVDNAIIAPTEETFTATRNYTVNDLVIVNDTLYKVTANIANGGTITPNSNVQQTTLSALIKALS